jgi:hypothetical protein
MGGLGDVMVARANISNDCVRVDLQIGANADSISIHAGLAVSCPGGSDGERVRQRQ